MGFPRQQYWRGVPFPSSGDLPEPGIEPRSPTWQTDSYHCPEPAVRGPGSPRLGRTAPRRFFAALGSPWEDSYGGLQNLPAQERVPTSAGGGYPPGHLNISP